MTRAEVKNEKEFIFNTKKFWNRQEFWKLKSMVDHTGWQKRFRLPAQDNKTSEDDWKTAWL